MTCNLCICLLTTVVEINHPHSIDELEINHPRSIDKQGSVPDVHQSSVSTEIVPGLSESSWFYRVITLMIAFALVLVGDVLYNYPSAPINHINSWSTDSLTDIDDIPGMFVEYVMLLGLCAYILFFFAALCLGFASNYLSLPSLVLVYWSKGNPLSRRGRKVICECLWAILLVTLVAGVVLFDWYLFDGPHAPLEKFPPW